MLRNLSPCIQVSKKLTRIGCSISTNSCSARNSKKSFERCTSACFSRNQSENNSRNETLTCYLLAQRLSITRAIRLVRIQRAVHTRVGYRTSRVVFDGCCVATIITRSTLKIRIRAFSHRLYNRQPAHVPTSSASMAWKKWLYSLGCGKNLGFETQRTISSKSFSSCALWGRLVRYAICIKSFLPS